MSKHNAYLKDENLLTLFSLNNMIIPEIQREYVWGNNTDVLDEFLKELEIKATPCETCHHVHTNKNINVGFLYSYKPLYVKYENERILDEFIIDGQQRMTTLFLLLLYRATVEDRIDDFLTIFRVDENSHEMGFNYKVRNLTQQFLIHLINHIQKERKASFDFISDMDNTPYWFLDDYRTDPTVMSMISALKSIKKVFCNSENLYFDYLLTNIHFWHFKTEATSQGEELYITMNSRGEQLSDNEMQKARILPDTEQVRYGQYWEEWQTFFWRNRKMGYSDNQNADKGFNNFLACAEGLEHFNKRECLNVDRIRTYMDGLKLICSTDFRERISKKYNGLYLGWFDSFIDCLWNEINTYDGKWDINDPRGGDQMLRNDYKNKSVARNKTMLFWPWMTYFRICDGNIDEYLLFRILHFYYIRYKCYKRSSTSIESIINCFINTGGRIHMQPQSDTDDEEEDNINSRTFSDEEILLSSLYFTDESRILETESAIWEIQDLSYFIDGKGVGGNTIYESFRDNGIIDSSNLDSIKLFKQRITGLLGNDDGKTSHIDIKRILLFYISEGKAFWAQQSPWYYNNYETSSWKRIVRSAHFVQFYKDFISAGVSLTDFLEVKRKEFFSKDENRIIDRNGKPWSHRKIAILYDILSENGIWDPKHENIVFWKNQNQQSVDGVFIGQDTVWKAQRYYDAKNETVLTKNWKEKLKDLYNVQIVDLNTDKKEDNEEA